MKEGDKVVIVEFGPMSSMAEYTGQQGSIIKLSSKPTATVVDVELGTGKTISTASKFVKVIN